MQQTSFAYLENVPDDFARHSPHASALQSIETSFFLIAMERYPHALASCVFALESALKESPLLGMTSKKKPTLYDLFEQAVAESTCPVSEEDLKALRKLRNHVAHQGYGPGDDSPAVRLLLNASYPMLDWVYAKYFQFSWRDHLPSDLRRHLEAATQATRRAHAAGETDVVFAIGALGHLLRWQFRKAQVSGWESYVLEEDWAHEQRFIQSDHFARTWQDKHDPAWRFDCAVCDGIESFACTFELDALAAGRAELGEGLCTDCELLIPGTGHYLSTVLHAEDLLAKRDTVLREFGIQTR